MARRIATSAGAADGGGRPHREGGRSARSRGRSYAIKPSGNRVDPQPCQDLPAANAPTAPKTRSAARHDPKAAPISSLTPAMQYGRKGGEAVCGA